MNTSAIFWKKKNSDKQAKVSFDLGQIESCVACGTNEFQIVFYSYEKNLQFLIIFSRLSKNYLLNFELMIQLKEING